MSGRGSRGRVPGHGGGREGPGQVRQAVPGFCRCDHAVGADEDGQCRVARQAPQARGPSVTGEIDVDPAGVCVRAGWSGGSCAGCCLADPDEDEAVPAAEARQSGVGPPGGQHGGASGQDRVQPDGGAVTGGDQRVGDQAAGPQRGGGAGRAEMPRDWLQGAGLQPGRGGGAHGLADAVAADGGGQGDPADGGGPVLAAGHRPADPDGLLDQGPGVRAAFGLVAGQQAALARPVSTCASFQARLSASRSPAARPWPMNGGVRCAASPSRKMRPAWKRDARRARKV